MCIALPSLHLLVLLCSGYLSTRPGTRTAINFLNEKGKEGLGWKNCVTDGNRNEMVADASVCVACYVFAHKNIETFVQNISVRL